MYRLTANVKGRVQGVGFRYFVIREARNIGGIGGFAKNLPDGTVEVIAEGDRQKLEHLKDRIAQGPPASVVEGVSDTWSQIEKPVYRSFDMSF